MAAALAPWAVARAPSLMAELTPSPRRMSLATFTPCVADWRPAREPAAIWAGEGAFAVLSAGRSGSFSVLSTAVGGDGAVRS